MGEINVNGSFPDNGQGETFYLNRKTVILLVERH